MMNSVGRTGYPKRTGRIVGVLLLLHLVVGLMTPFILLDQVRGTEGLFANAAGSATIFRAAVMLLFAGSALAVGIAVTALPVFRLHSAAMSLWLFALAIAGFALQAVDNGALLSILSLSQEYAQGDPVKADLYQAVALAAGSARRWAHYAYLLVAVGWIVLFCALLLRFRLVPRILAAVGLACSLMQIGGVTLRAMWGLPPMTILAIPLAPAYLALAGWLMARGFGEGPGPSGATADEAGLARSGAVA